MLWQLPQKSDFAWCSEYSVSWYGDFASSSVARLVLPGDMTNDALPCSSTAVLVRLVPEIV